MRLLDKPALVYWANKIGLEGVSISEHRKQSAAKGTSIHDQIKRRFATGQQLDDADSDTRMTEFLSGFKVEASEEVVETDLFIGRLDCRLSDRRGMFIVDFKSSESIYIEQVLQLAAYRMAFPLAQLAVVEIPSFKLKHLKIDDFAPFEEIITALAVIHSNLKLAKWSA